MAAPIPPGNIGRHPPAPPDRASRMHVGQCRSLPGGPYRRALPHDPTDGQNQPTAAGERGTLELDTRVRCAPSPIASCASRQPSGQSPPAILVQEAPRGFLEEPWPFSRGSPRQGRAPRSCPRSGGGPLLETPASPSRHISELDDGVTRRSVWGPAPRSPGLPEFGSIQIESLRNLPRLGLRSLDVEEDAEASRRLSARLSVDPQAYGDGQGPVESHQPGGPSWPRRRASTDWEA